MGIRFSVTDQDEVSFVKLPSQYTSLLFLNRQLITLRGEVKTNELTTLRAYPHCKVFEAYSLKLIPKQTVFYNAFLMEISRLAF